MTITLSDDASRLQVDRIHGWLASSYWSPGIERALVERAIAGSRDRTASVRTATTCRSVSSG